MDDESALIDIANLPDVEALKRQIAQVRVRISEPDMIKLRETNRGVFRMKIQKEFSYLADNYPFVLKMTIDENCNDAILFSMLNIVSKMKSGKLTQEEGTQRIREIVFRAYNLEQFIDK